MRALLAVMARVPPEMLLEKKVQKMRPL